MQNAPCGVKDNDNIETEHDANKAARESYKNLPGMPLLCEISEISWLFDNIIGKIWISTWYSLLCFLKLWSNMSLYVVETLSKGVNSIANESKDAVQSPLRKALSPININGNQKPLEALSSTQTPFLATCSTTKGIQKNDTPLDKFSTRSSTLKVQPVSDSTNIWTFWTSMLTSSIFYVQNCLVEEYIDFLNNANRWCTQTLLCILHTY